MPCYCRTVLLDDVDAVRTARTHKTRVGGFHGGDQGSFTSWCDNKDILSQAFIKIQPSQHHYAASVLL